MNTIDCINQNQAVSKYVSLPASEMQIQLPFAENSIAFICDNSLIQCKK